MVGSYLFGNKVDEAIELLQRWELKRDGLMVAFSGGKDSQCVYHLCEDAGVKFDAVYNVTSVDPPELIRFIKKHYPNVKFNYPEKTMWSLIASKRMPPTRLARYCCQSLKECFRPEGILITGIRKEESTKRGKRHMVELVGNTLMLHPLFNWTDDDVWAYHQSKGLAHCSLYDEGYSRIGCIMCPMKRSRGMQTDAKRWPRYAENYKRAFQKCYEKRIEDGLPTEWKSGQDMYEWWIGQNGKKTPKGQGKINL